MADKPIPLPPSDRVSVIGNKDGLTSRQIPEGSIPATSAICVVDADDAQILQVFGVSSNQEKVHVFGENGTVSKDVVSIIQTYTVPALKSFRLTGFTAWGDSDGEYFLNVDDVQKGGGRTSIASPTLSEIFFFDGLVVIPEADITIEVLYSTGSATQPFKSNIRGILTDV